MTDFTVPARPLSMGEIWKTTLRLSGMYFWRFFPWYVLLQAVLFILQVLWIKAHPLPQFTHAALSLPVLPVSMYIILGFFSLAMLYLFALVQHQTGHRLLGTPVSWRESTTLIGKRFIRLIVAYLIVIVLFIAGLMIFVVPGIIAIVILSIYYPVILLEDLPLGKALRRTWQMGWRELWRLFVTLLVTALLCFVVSIIFLVVIELIAGLASLSFWQSLLAPTTLIEVKNLLVIGLGFLFNGYVLFYFTILPVTLWYSTKQRAAVNSRA